jgi:hypothetical protein
LVSPPQSSLTIVDSSLLSLYGCPSHLDSLIIIGCPNLTDIKDIKTANTISIPIRNYESSTGQSLLNQILGMNVGEAMFGNAQIDNIFVEWKTVSEDEKPKRRIEFMRRIRDAWPKNI